MKLSTSLLADSAKPSAAKSPANSGVNPSRPLPRSDAASTAGPRSFSSQLHSSVARSAQGRTEPRTAGAEAKKAEPASRKADSTADRAKTAARRSDAADARKADRQENRQADRQDAARAARQELGRVNRDARPESDLPLADDAAPSDAPTDSATTDACTKGPGRTTRSTGKSIDPTDAAPTDELPTDPSTDPATATLTLDTDVDPEAVTDAAAATTDDAEDSSDAPAAQTPAQPWDLWNLANRPTPQPDPTTTPAPTEAAGPVAPTDAAAQLDPAAALAGATDADAAPATSPDAASPADRRAQSLGHDGPAHAKPSGGFLSSDPLPPVHSPVQSPTQSSASTPDGSAPSTAAATGVAPSASDALPSDPAAAPAPPAHLSQRLEDFSRLFDASSNQPNTTAADGPAHLKGHDAPDYAPEARFADVNTPPVVSAVRGQLNAGGGTLTLRLDPPEVGALQVAVTMKNGLATVSLQTDNPEAARLITHTLSQLRDSLQAAGISVEKLTVQQAAPKPESSDSGNSRHNGSGANGQPQAWQQDDSARRDQQRRELLERMWRKASGDDVNLVA